MRQYSVVNLVARILRGSTGTPSARRREICQPAGSVKLMRRSSPVNAWTKTIALSTAQPVPPSILMMCFFW